MNKNKLLMAALVAIVLGGLAGCETTPKQPVITKTEFKEVPASLLAKGCKPVAPPPVAEYVMAPVEKQKEMLIRHDAANISVIQGCDDTIGAIRSWNEQQKKIYGKP